MYLFDIMYTYIKKGTNAGIDVNKAKQSLLLRVQTGTVPMRINMEGSQKARYRNKSIQSRYTTLEHISRGDLNLTTEMPANPYI